MVAHFRRTSGSKPTGLFTFVGLYPVLSFFLTARIEDTDKVKGFAVGGDDYIVKPFSLMDE